MGSWGYGSFENDAALDFVSELFNEKAIKRLVCKNKIDQYDYDEIRVSAEIIIHLHKINNLWIEQETRDGLVGALNVIIQDEDWFNSWREEKPAAAMKKQLKLFVKQLKKIKTY